MDGMHLKHLGSYSPRQTALAECSSAGIDKSRGYVGREEHNMSIKMVQPDEGQLLNIYRPESGAKSASMGGYEYSRSNFKLKLLGCGFSVDIYDP